MSCSGSRMAVFLAALFLLGACSISMALPGEFLQLESDGSELKATTPDDARLWVRQFEDRDRGDLQFWAESLKLDLVRNRGYELVEETELRDGEGREGVQMQFALTTQGEPHGYLVALFVFEATSANMILTGEFVAPPPVFEEHLEAVQASLLTIQR